MFHPPTLGSLIVKVWAASYNLVPCTQHNALFKQKHCKNCKTLPKEHLISFQCVKLFLLKDPFNFFLIKRDLSYFKFFTSWVFEFCHNLGSPVLSQFEFCHIERFGFSSQLDFCHNLSLFTTCLLPTILVLSPFEFCHNLSVVTIWVFFSSHNSTLVTHLVLEFCQNLNFLSFVTLWVFEIFTMWVLEFCYYLVSSQFEVLNFVII